MYALLQVQTVKKNRFDFRKLINPVTVSIFLAVICVLTGIRLPEVLNNSLQKIGQTATPLAMIYLGGVFACIDVLKKYPETGLLMELSS